MHHLAVGMTGAGKSTLYKALCRQYRRRRRVVMVFDPMHDDNWPCDWKTNNIDMFFRECWRRKGLILVIDEAGQIGKWNKPLEKLVTQGRHLGHSIHIACQFPQQLAPIVRGMCRHGYVFNVGEEEIDTMARSFNKKALRELPPPAVIDGKSGEFYQFSRFSEISKYSIDFRTGNVYKLSAHLCK